MKALAGPFLCALAVAGQNAVPANGGRRFVTLSRTYSGSWVTDQGTMTLMQGEKSEVIVDEFWPRHPIRTAFRRALDWISFQYYLRTHEPTSAKMPENCVGVGMRPWRDKIFWASR
jgi:hypothetical protein